MSLQGLSCHHDPALPLSLIVCRDASRCAAREGWDCLASSTKTKSICCPDCGKGGSDVPFRYFSGTSNKKGPPTRVSTFPLTNVRASSYRMWPGRELNPRHADFKGACQLSCRVMVKGVSLVRWSTLNLPEASRLHQQDGRAEPQDSQVADTVPTLVKISPAQIEQLISTEKTQDHEEEPSPSWPQPRRVTRPTIPLVCAQGRSRASSSHPLELTSPQDPELTSY